MIPLIIFRKRHSMSAYIRKGGLTFVVEIKNKPLLSIENDIRKVEYDGAGCNIAK